MDFRFSATDEAFRDGPMLDDAHRKDAIRHLEGLHDVPRPEGMPETAHHEAMERILLLIEHLKQQGS